jgi:hypothetical protein
VTSEREVQDGSFETLLRDPHLSCTTRLTLKGQFEISERTDGQTGLSKAPLDLKKGTWGHGRPGCGWFVPSLHEVANWPDIVLP